MIHIASVHWKNADWIDLQLKHLRRHLAEPYRVYAFLNDIPDGHRDKFFHASTEPIRDHAVKLNLLADVVLASPAGADDFLIFLDGDAFPIADPMPLVREGLASHRLVAVQRLENNGDRQPHPCFCATTVGFWREIGGDWREGHTWPDLEGMPTTDVGGNLLGILEARGIPWLALHRSNRTNLHPLWFGVYAGIVYHHGAGFRQSKLSRADLRLLSDARERLGPARRAASAIADRLLSRSPIRSLRGYTALQRAMQRNATLSEEFFARIRADDRFHEALT